MRYKIKYYYILIIICVFAFNNAFAQPLNSTQNSSKASLNKAPFEGIIKFVQETFSDTTYYTYYIKGDKVKLEINEDCKDCDVSDAMLFDLKKQSITALKPSLRIYKDIEVKPYVEANNKDFNIIKNARNKKNVDGYKCEQWRVKNQKENTEITYWVTEGNYSFFEEFLKLWNRSEKQSRYFLQVKSSKGYFPILSVERSTFREKRMKLQVIKLERKPLEQSIFEIPVEYKNYDN